MSDETVTDGIMSELHREEEFAADRFASALESVERGHPLDQRDREDPDLAPMVNVAGLLHRTWNSVTPDLDYFARTRSTVLAAMPRPVEQADDGPISLIARLRQSPVFAPIASAAAAGFAAVMITLQLAGGGADTVAPMVASVSPTTTVEPTPLVAEQPAVVITPSALAELASLLESPDENALAESHPVLDIAKALDRLTANIGALGLRVQLRAPISAGLLNDISGDLARISARISGEPQSIDREDVVAFAQQAVDGVTIMEELLVEERVSGALAVAQFTAELGRSTVAIYFYNNTSN